MRKLLLHVCCAPCLIVPFSEFSKKFDITLFFYNPNIHPIKEYKERLKTLKGYSKSLNVPLIIGEYDYKSYFFNVSYPYRFKERCIFCYQIRMNETGRMAAKMGFQFFSTTLLYSPYQVHDKLVRIAEFVAKEYNLTFIYRDFRNRYREGVEKSRELSMYRQKYCGCIFSEFERYGGKLVR